MCGIAGVLDTRGGVPAAELESLVGRMADQLRHRGPDDRGVWCDPATGVALGHRRLSILDTSPLGRQPMTSSCGRIVLTYNGEIYNFAELRQTLEGLGRRFRGRSDSEVLVEAIAEWGIERALRRANGMFALAAWDVDRRRLVLARDRFGEKPLYHGWLGASFAFASELAAMRVHPRWAGGIDRAALVDYLRFGSIPAPRAIHPGVHKLPPATFVEIDPSRPGEIPEPRPYWSLADLAAKGPDPLMRQDPAAAMAGLEETLREAVRSRMVSDVPLGALLSGGVDSALVVALMQQVATEPVKTFTIGFDERDYDESGDAAAIAAALGTDHSALVVRSDEARRVIPEIPRVYDEPFGDSSQIPTMLVARLARERVTVALSGDGGDELFGGYYRHFWAPHFWATAGRVPRPLRAGAGAVLDAVPRRGVMQLARVAGAVSPRLAAVRSLPDKAQKLGGLMGARSLDDVYWKMISHWREAEAVVLGATAEDTPGRRSRDLDRVRDGRDRLLVLDAEGYLPDDILTKVDRATMAVGLESRAPLLDHRVAEYAWGLDPHLKIRDGEGKWALRDIVRRLVPGGTATRPKSGFRVPVGDWLRGPLRPWAEDLLSPARLRRQGLLDEGRVRRVWHAHTNGSRNHGNQLWDVLMLQAWLDEHDVSEA